MFAQRVSFCEISGYPVASLRRCFPTRTTPIRCPRGDQRFDIFFSTEKRHRKIGSETRKWANYLDSHIFECMIIYDTHTYIHIYIIDSIDTWDNSKTATKQNRDLTKQHNNRSNTHLSTGDVNTSWWNFRLNPMATWPREYPTAHPYFPVRFQWLMVQLLQIPTISPGFIL